MRRAVLALSVLLAALALQSCSTKQDGQAVPVGTTSSIAAAPAASGSSGADPAPSRSSSPLPAAGRTVTVTTTPTSSSRPTTSAAPTPKAGAAPPCWSAGTCPVLARIGLAGGWTVVVVNPSDNATVMILLSGALAYDQVSMRNLGAHPVLTCLTVTGAPTCLMSGVPGAHTAFGSVARVLNGRLVNLTQGEMYSEGGFAYVKFDSSSALIVGRIAFGDYGVSYAASPEAYVTWSVTGTMTRTGCSAPALASPAPPTAAQHGPCTGTPMISGYAAGSAAKILDLGGGIVSASGNLWCVDQPYGRGEVDCSISKADFTVAKPCVGEPGTIVRWPTGGPPTLSGCQGDTMVAAGRQPIGYGQLAMSGDVICVISQTGGVRCENSDHHGFVLSRAKFTTF